MKTLLSRVTDGFGSLRRAVLLHRRALAALAAAAAVWTGLQAAAGPPIRTVPVWVAARDLPGGATLTADALRRTGMLPEHVPAGAVTAPRAVVGRTLVAPLRRGQVLTDESTVGQRWLAGRPGLTAVPVRLTDPGVAGLLRPGDHVAVLASDPQHPGDTHELAAEATVLTVPAADTDGELHGRLVVMGVPAGVSEATASASASMFVTVAWTG
ncbi:MAG: SAF domain-containing protein [Marmoricola sp.]